MKRREFLKTTFLGFLGIGVTDALASEYERRKRHHEEEYKEDHECEHYEEHHGKRELKRLQNRENPTVMEQKHVPLVIAPERVRSGKFFEVKVQVGFRKNHPSTPEHWITKIALLVNGKRWAKTVYPKGGVAPSEATFRIRLQSDATIEAVEHCNLHGTWISEPVRVKVY